MQARILLSSSKRPASYMRMFYVSSQATKQVAARLREGEADDVAGYVIDLRNNPGAFPAPPAFAFVAGCTVWLCACCHQMVLPHDCHEKDFAWEPEARVSALQALI